jgi:hypothetical protein
MVKKLFLMPPTQQGFMAQLTKDLREQPNQSEEQVRMVGILFAPPEIQLSKSEIIPELTYFHLRSDNRFSLYCAGYTYEKNEATTGRVIVELDHRKWYFSVPRFEQTRQSVVANSTWKYSGGTDLILVNAGLQTLSQVIEDDMDMPRRASRTESYLDFSGAIAVTFEELLKQKAIASVSIFFESIFKFTDDFKGNDPTWGFSDSQGKKLVGSALKKFLLHLLPKPFRSPAEQAFNFAVKDISADKGRRASL